MLGRSLSTDGRSDIIGRSHIGRVPHSQYPEWEKGVSKVRLG